MADQRVKKHSKHKSINWLASEIRDADSTVLCYPLSERSRLLMLALVDFVGWKTRYDGDVTQDEIDSWKGDLVYQLQNEQPCDPDTETETCVDYPPNALFIKYAPNDPFQTPLYVPAGYFQPPWYTNPLIRLPGVLPSDAMVNFLSIIPPVPPFNVLEILQGLIASGLPRFRISLEGTGTVEMEFVKIVQGGLVLTIVDDDLLKNQVFSLNSLTFDLAFLEDIFDIVVEQTLDDTEIMQFEFTASGSHHIDVTFLPDFSIDLEPIGVGFGGGLRRVELCGDLQIVEGDMAQFQVDNCMLQWRPHSETAWIDLVDLTTCTTPGSPGVDGASPEMRVSGGFIQWRQDDDSPTWTNLVALADLKGDDGAQGVPGAQGEQGIPGQDATCEDCAPQIPPPDSETYPNDDICCIASNNATNVMNNMIDNAYAQINAGAAFVAIVAAILAVLAIIITGGAATPVVIALVAALIDLGAAGILAAFTTDVYEALNCALYCECVNAQWADLNAVKTRITEEIGTPCAPIFNLMLDAMGLVGLNNAAGVGTGGSYDCTECVCTPPTVCVELDLRDVQGGFTPEAGCISWESGLGWKRPATGCTEYKVFRDIGAIVSAIEYEHSPTGNGLFNLRAYDASNNGLTATTTEDVTPIYSGIRRQRKTYEPPVFVDRIEIDLRSSTSEQRYLIGLLVECVEE